MNHKEWLRREIVLWRNEGIVAEDVAEVLMKRYSPPERRFSWGVMIASGFGALLVGLGMISLFAANWDSLGRPIRAMISFAPIVFCGALAWVASAKGWKSMQFWEPLGLFWCIALGAGASLVAQTYQVGGSVSALILFVALLMLPTIWITRSIILIHVSVLRLKAWG